MMTMIAVGRISKQPSFSTSQKGTPLLKFEIEINQGEGKWPQRLGVIMFYKLAESFASILTTGQMISVLGTPQWRGYLDRQNQARGACDLIARELSIIAEPYAPPQAQQPETLMGGSPTVADTTQESFLDDIPF